MDVLGDAIARDRRSDATALSAPAVGREYDYRRFCTTAWKAGNFLRLLGVRGGVTVGIADDPIPEPVLTLFGAAALGAVVRFGPPETIDDGTRALVVPAAAVDDYEVGPATKRVVYGDPPGDPTISYFERDVWSENPTEPPDHVDSDDPLLWTSGETYTHGEILAAAQRVVDEAGLDVDSTVAVRGSFADPSVVVAGLIAPIVAGAQVVIGPEATGERVVGGDGEDIDAVEIT
ncbi:MAG: AMP-binding protein [Halobacteriota archaeon]|uniref:AMP-binding protein n=1 Tax=Natronomonas sp. TaxID=2184060 RepID=UPI0039758447